MAYTALKMMREVNREKWGRETGPAEPPLYQNRKNKNDLKSAALRFLHEECEELRFDENIEQEEERSGKYQGKSLTANQIPYNMEMDLNRLCLEKALENFIDSGVAEDAYMVYYCYLEIFFGQYGKSKKMVELLSEYESNGSSLLMKHRDHYSHSVYVFALGLAIYETNANIRREFRKYYGIDPDETNREENRRACLLFLKFWGLTSLFHDIGYPFELPFEQVLSYFEVNNENRGADKPYLGYRAIENVITLDDAGRAHFKKLYKKTFATTNELLAFNITQKLGKTYGFDYSYMLDVINRKPVKPEDFGYYMDHAFFSAVRLYRELEDIFGVDNLEKIHIDALSAILLHNSLFKFSVAFYKSTDPKEPLRCELHPLAYLLMLCDELQCWDRTAYGRNSRTELHPMAADFSFSDDAIHVVYYYDQAEHRKIEDFNTDYAAWESGQRKEKPRLKDYSDMAGKDQRFTNDIEKIVNMENFSLKAVPSLRKIDYRSKHTYLSNSNFLHLYDFAVALHGKNMPQDVTTEQMEEKFNSLSLEYQISSINRAKSFGRYLDAIHCFYTDKPVDYEMVKQFTARDAAIFAPMEHERWVREHQNMGWHYGTDYETLPLNVSGDEAKVLRAAMREQMRQHKLTMDGRLTAESIRRHYMGLSRADQDKDWKPFNSMLELMKKFDGVRIYKF